MVIIQKGLRSNIVHYRKVIESHPIIQSYIEKLKIGEAIGAFIKQDARLELSVEKTLCLMIHNILTTPKPMYEISDWLKPLNEEHIGMTTDEAQLINDDRVGKALEKFYVGRHKDVFFHLALRAIKLFQLDCSQMHQDTTSITFSGKYAGWSASELLTYGHNKDHRPDLKQLVLGMSVTADGSVPLMHRIYSGHQSDDKVHLRNHERLRKLLGKSDFIYVADCKLATDENLNKIAACGGLFISVMPRTWKEDTQFREKVRQGSIKWKRILSRPDHRHPDSRRHRHLYDLAEGSYCSQKGGHRLLWILSSEKKQRDQETRQRHLARAIEDLKIIQTKLNRYHLKTQDQIQKRVNELLSLCQCSEFFRWHIEDQIQETYHYGNTGRPKADAKKKKAIEKYFSLRFELDSTALARAEMTDGIFPLITNVDEKMRSAKKVLETYKYQPFLEKRHTQLKTYQEIDPVYLKKDIRVVSYLHMHVMALMVATLIERQLRLTMKLSKIKSLPIYPEQKPCKAPTMYDIVRLFSGVECYELHQGDHVEVIPAQLSKLQKQVIKMLGVPLSAYI